MLQLIAEANSENSAGNFRRVTCMVEGAGLQEAVRRREKERG